MSCEVIQAVDGQDAHEKIHRFLPDLVILDIQMPRMDGYELLRKIRTELTTVFIPVILLTERNRCEDRVKGFVLPSVNVRSRSYSQIPSLSDYP